MKKIEGQRIHVAVRLPVAQHHALKRKAVEQYTTVQALLLRAIQEILAS